MHILLLDQFSEMGGAQLCVLDLLPALIGRGHSIHVAAPPGGALADESRRRGASFDPIHCGPYSRGRKSVADMLRFAAGLSRLRAEIARLAERYRPGLIYMNGPRLLPAATWAAGRRIPVLFHCHSYLRQHYARWLAGRSLRAANATLVAACRFVGQPLRGWVDLSRFSVVYNGVPESPYPHREFAPGGIWRIGVIGRIAPEKGQAMFLDAARLLANFCPACRFIICGGAIADDPATAKYSAKVRKAAAGLPVEFTGWRKDIYAVLADLDILVAPSAPNEATTRVILEAYAAGVPVVATESGGIPEVLASGETGYLAERFTPYALANRIHALIASPEKQLRQFSENARAAWRERYSLDRYQRKMVEIVESSAFTSSAQHCPEQ